MNRRFFSSLLAVALAVPCAARAQGNAAAAQQLFDDAKKLMEQKKYADACPKFAESQRLDPSGGTLLHLGICHESEGKTASAYAELNEAVSMARRDNRADRENVAKAHLASLQAKIVRLTVNVSPEAKATKGLEVKWDGNALGDAQYGSAFPVDPGDITVTASAPGKKAWSTKITVAPKSTGSNVLVPALANDDPPPPVAVVVPPPVTTPPPPPPVTEPPPAAEDTGSTRRTAGFVVGGAGLASLIVAGVFELRSRSLASDRDDAAARGDGPGTAKGQSDAKSAQLVAIILGSAGVVALGSGALLVLTSHSSRIALRPTFGPRMSGLALDGSLSW